jgi:hypothetical protein
VPCSFSARTNAGLTSLTPGARRRGPGCERSEHRAKPGCGLDAGEHVGTINQAQMNKKRLSFWSVAEG